MVLVREEEKDLREEKGAMGDYVVCVALLS